MKTARTLVLPILVSVMLCANVSTPARAQFAGGGFEQMEQFAPLLDMIKKKMGKKRFGQVMQMVGPMMSGEGGGLGNIAGMMGGGNMGGVDLGSISGMVGGGNLGGFDPGMISGAIGGHGLGGIGQMIGRHDGPDPARSSQ